MDGHLDGDVVAVVVDEADTANNSGTFDDVGVNDSVTISASGPDVGDSANVTITSTYSTLTGFLDPIFNGLTIDTSVEFRLLEHLARNSGQVQDRRELLARVRAVLRRSDGSKKRLTHYSFADVELDFEEGTLLDLCLFGDFLVEVDDPGYQ